MGEQMELFFNTTHLVGEELEKSVDAAAYQNARVANIMKSQKYGATPRTVYNIYLNIHGAVELTSIRRSMTVLTSQGVLVKTIMIATQDNGAKAHMWIHSSFPISNIIQSTNC